MRAYMARRSFLVQLGGLMVAAPGLSGRGEAGERAPVRSMLEMRRDGVIVQEYDVSCGAAALATLLRFQHGDPVTERQLLRILISRDIYMDDPGRVQAQQGFSLLDLKRAAEARGFTGLGYGDLRLADLLDLAPVITPIAPKGYAHFVVLLGLKGDRLFLADPAFGNITMSAERFNRIWLDVPELGYVAFVVTQGEEVAQAGRLRPNPRVFLMPPPAALRQALF